MNPASTFVQGTMTADQVSTAAQRQYFNRPDDQKFMDLDAMLDRVRNRRMNTIEVETEITDVRVRQTETGIVLRAKGEDMTPSHWAFGQTCSLIGAPSAYLRKLSSQGAEDLVVRAMNHGIAKRDAGGFKLMAVDENADAGYSVMYAATSPTYGRIWDADVVESTKTVIDAQNGTFYSPLAWSKTHRALFASQQDCFMYFIDGGSIVDGGGARDQLHRGIYIWNSEVGAATFGIATFLFRETCGNFLVWGVQNARILNIRHTSGGPMKFVNEAVPALREFAASSVADLEAGVKAAKSYALPTDEDEIVKFCMRHGFNRAESKRAINQANLEEGRCASLWDLVNGFTATARLMAFADAKADLEVRAGKLMKVAEDKTSSTMLVGA